LTEQTNVAIEFAHMCQNLAYPDERSGGEVLAERFQVAAYSPEFFEMLAIITGITRQLEAALASESIHPSIVSNATGHLQAIREAFSRHGLNGAWKGIGSQSLGAAHSDPVLHLSGHLRSLDYIKPSPDEVSEILADARGLLQWLEENEIEQSDFIRVCIIDGLKRFIFRLEKIGFIGWPHAIESLREIVGAYLALERGYIPAEMPKTGALMKKVAAALELPITIISKAREAKDNIEFLTLAYKGVGRPALGFVAGLITHAVSS